MKVLFAALLIFTTSLGFSQEKIVSVSFFKNNGRISNNPDSADYSRYISMPDSGSTLYNIVEYYKNHKTKLTGKTSKYNTAVLEGQCAEFYQTGIKKCVINYKNNLPVGTANYFFPNGKAYLKLEYPDNGSIYNDIENNFSITANFDSLGTVLVENGNGYYKGYEDTFFYIEAEGPVKNGKREGNWKGFIKSLLITYTETYKDGIIVNGTSIDKFGKSVSYNKNTRSSPPQFRGGVSDFVNYLASNIHYPSDARQNYTQGRVMVSFIIDKDGRVDQVKVINSVSPSIDAEAVRVIKECPRWKPGKQYGESVNVAYVVPVNFTLSPN